MVDENFIAKVADAGIAQLLQRLEDAGPSQSSGGNVFQDPEYVHFLQFASENFMNDIIFKAWVVLYNIVYVISCNYISFTISNELYYSMKSCSYLC